MEVVWLCDSVTLSLCHSVVNKRSNISAPFHPFGPKFFLRPFGQKSMSQKFFFLRPRGPKNSDFSGYLSYFTRHRSENWNLGLKLENKIKKIFTKISADGRGPRAEFDYAYFGPYQILHMYDPHLFSILNLKWSKKNLSAHIWPFGSHAFDQNGPPHGALITWAVKFFLKSNV